MKSQNQQILEYLQAGNSISPMEALHLFNCWALSSRISDLRKEGHDITSVMETGENGKVYARYAMGKNEGYIFTEEPKQLAFIR